MKNCYGKSRWLTQVILAIPAILVCQRVEGSNTLQTELGAVAEQVAAVLTQQNETVVSVGEIR